MFPEPKELLLIGCSIESMWTLRSKSNMLTQKPTRRHTDKGKFHTWRMESSFVFVQHQPFQFHQLSWSDVEKNARRCRWRKSHSKIKADDEFGLTIQREGSESACLDCIGKHRENQIGKSDSTSELVEWAAAKNGETCEGRLLIKLLRMECWRKTVFSRVEIWWNVGSKNGETRRWQVCHQRWYGLWHRRRIRHVVVIQIILAQGEWSIAKDIGPLFKRYNARHRQTFSFGECLCLQHWKHLYSSSKQMFDISEKLIIEQSGETLGVSQISWEDSPWRQLSLVNDKEVISLSRAKVYVFSDSVLCLGKVNQNPASNTFWEEQLSWFKDSPQYRTLDTIDGEPMEFEWNIFPFTTLQLINKVQEFMNNMGDPAQLQGRIIFMSMLKDIIWWSTDNERECIANTAFVSWFAIRFPAGRWSFFGPGSEKKWLSIYIDRPRGELDGVAELLIIKFRESGHPVFRDTSPFSRGTLTSKGGRKISIHFCADGRYDWNCFSHNYFC